MNLVVDTREQLPLEFGKEHTVVRDALPCGDYSLLGLESRVACERKSEADLLGSITHDRDRFERELAKARGYDLFYIIIESTWARIAQGQYRSRMLPHAVLQTLFGYEQRFGIRFHLVGSHAAAAYAVESIFQHYLSQRCKLARQYLVHVGEFQNLREAFGLGRAQKAHTSVPAGGDDKSCTDAKKTA